MKSMKKFEGCIERERELALAREREVALAREGGRGLEMR